MTLTIVAFVVCLIAMTTVGSLSVLYKKKKTEDYLIASRQTPAWLAALSAVSTNNSGFMFIGMIAYTYRLGIESVWMMVGWVLGDVVAWILVHGRLRRQSPDVDAKSLPAFLGTREEYTRRGVIIAGGLVTIIFLSIYAAGQLKAGATALHALFGWNMHIGAVIGAVIVIIYSYAGGIRADIWTDAAQSFLMIVTMALVMVMGSLQVGGPAALFDELRSQDPSLVSIWPQDLRFGLVFFLLGMLAGGMSSAGQPHLVTRYMAIESIEAIKPAFRWYFAWYVPFFLASIGVGLYSRAIIPAISELEIAQAMDQPTELALPLVTMRLLPDFFVGVVLAGLFAATVSTADSQIIVCSGAINQDIQPKWRESYLASKIGTFSVTALALVIALYAPEGVFGLVLIAWSAMGASLGPLLLLRVFKRDPPSPVAITMMAAGLLAVIVWHVSGFDDDVFKALPGFVAVAVVYGVWLAGKRLLQRKST
jgi:sodium/proline symporter